MKIQNFIILVLTACAQAEWWSLTFDAEGNDNPGSPYFSRRLHVPSGSSGLTIGRGYDMKLRSRSSVKSDLIRAGLSSGDADKISHGAGYSGSSAKKFIKDHKLQGFTITNGQQLSLFKIELQRKIADAKRIFTKADVVKKYGAANFDTRKDAIKGLVIDLLYRGDYTGTTRRFLQPAIVKNDVKSLLRLMSDRSRWSSVPRDRFNRRVAYLKKA